MTALLNSIFIDSFSYFNKESIEIEDALKLTDILLLQVEVDHTNEKEFISYLDNFIQLNRLLYVYYKEKVEGDEVKIFDSNNLEICKNLETTKKKVALLRHKQQRLAFYNRVEKELVNLVNKYRVNNKVA